MSWLVDKSALVRLGASSDAPAWRDRAERGLLRIASVTLLEVGYSARNAHDWRRLTQGPPVSWFPLEPITAAAEMRALQTQGTLAERGHHRAPSVADLLIASVAELAGLLVLHVDKDFELIAELTGQPVERLAGDF